MAKAVLIALGFVLLNLGAKLGAWALLAPLLPDTRVRGLVVGCFALALVIALTLWFCRRGRWLPLCDLRLFPRSHAGDGRQLAVGLLAGGGLFALVYVMVRLTGGITVTPVALTFPLILRALAVLAADTTLNAAWEEYTFRGVAFSACAAAMGSHRVAIGLGTVFGVLHLMNPDASAAVALSVSLAGYFLSYALLAALAAWGWFVRSERRR